MAGPSSSPVMIRLIAVSYTHLRAHETVLDLVCRLLLEKKKTKKSADYFYHTIESYNNYESNCHMSRGMITHTTKITF